MKLDFRLGAVALALAAAACSRVSEGGAGEGAAATHHPWTDPTTLRIAMTGAVNTLNPILSTQQFEVQAEALALDFLVATDPAGRDVPMLATRVPSTANGDISPDGTRITYHLRRGVVWQDGAPFTSRDVAFTWRAIMNPNTAVATRHGYDQIARLETPDPYTAVFYLKRPFAPAIHTFFAFSDSPMAIIPAHVLARYRDLNNVPFNSLPIGTGPFRIVRWARGDRIDYVANDRDFLGRPHIRKIVLRFVPDENTVAAELRAHEIDWFVQPSPRVYPQIKGLAGVDVRLVPFNGVDSIIFNTAHAPFSDARLRRAVSLAVDKQRLVDDVT